MHTRASSFTGDEQVFIFHFNKGPTREDILLEDFAVTIFFKERDINGRSFLFAENGKIIHPILKNSIPKQSFSEMNLFSLASRRTSDRFPFYYYYYTF